MGAPKAISLGGSITGNGMLIDAPQAGSLQANFSHPVSFCDSATSAASKAVESPTLCVLKAQLQD
jgi:hypothetical protein